MIPLYPWLCQDSAVAYPPLILSLFFSVWLQNPCLRVARWDWLSLLCLSLIVNCCFVLLSSYLHSPRQCLAHPVHSTKKAFHRLEWMASSHRAKPVPSALLPYKPPSTQQSLSDPRLQRNIIMPLTPDQTEASPVELQNAENVFFSWKPWLSVWHSKVGSGMPASNTHNAWYMLEVMGTNREP